MSDDLTIRPDEQYSCSTPKHPLLAFMRGLPGLKPSGTSGFALDDSPDRWMEIDLEVVREDGDNIEEAGQEYPEINCIRLHIPYGHFRSEQFEREYLPTALAIARYVNSPLLDEQSGQVWKPDES
jgi:hypothetical protein